MKEPFKDSAALIVQTLGSHLSDVTYVLRAVQERGKQVEGIYFVSYDMCFVKVDVFS